MFHLNRSLSLNTNIFKSLPRFLHYASALSIFTGDLKTDCRYVWTNFFRSIEIAFDFNFFPYAKVLSLSSFTEMLTLTDTFLASLKNKNVHEFLYSCFLEIVACILWNFIYHWTEKYYFHTFSLIFHKPFSNS